MAGKPSLTAPPNSSNSCRARSVLRSVISMGSLPIVASGEHLSPFGPVLHGLREAAAHLDDPGLPLGQRPHGLDEHPLPLADLDARVIVARALVREQLAKLGAFFGVDLRVDARDGLADLAQTPGFLRFYAEPLDEFLLGRVAAEFDAESVLGASQAVERINDVCRQTHGAGVVGDGAGDGLTDPPCRVSGEAVAHLGVELLDGPDQACVPLLDQVLEEHTSPPVLLGDGDHKPQVRLDELLTGSHVPPAGTPC